MTDRPGHIPTPDGKYVRLDGELPNGWQLLSSNDDDDQKFATRLAERHAGMLPEPPPPERVAVFIDAIVQARVVCRSVFDENSAAHFAASFHLQPLTPPLALATVAVLPFDDEPMTVDWLLENLRADEGRLVGRTDRKRLNLTLGPAVCARHVTSQSATDPGEMAELYEESVTVALPPGLPGVVQISAIWMDLSKGERLAAAADELAAAITIDFRQ